MEIGDTTSKTIVWTPYDALYPQFDPGWRHGISKAMGDHPRWSILCARPEIRNDPWIIGLHDYIHQCRTVGDDNLLDKRLWPYRYAMAWHNSGQLSNFRFRLEALLLTGAPFDVISMDLSGGDLPPEYFQLYEKIFFNVRDKEGRLHKSCFVRMNAALPNGQQLDRNTPADVLWKYIAMRFGYTGLVWCWGMPEPHGKRENDHLVVDELWRAAQAIMLEQVLRGTINNFDLNQNLGHYIDYRRMRHEIDQASGKEHQPELLLLEVLKKFAPKMLSESTEEHITQERTEAIHNRILAQQNVAQQVVPDFGKDIGILGVDNLIKKHFQDAAVKQKE